MNVMNALTGQNKIGSIGPYSGSPANTIPPGRMSEAYICLGICTWEHVWIHDHGVSAGAKRQFLEEWWKCIDWKIVEDNAAINRSNRISDTLRQPSGPRR